MLRTLHDSDRVFRAGELVGLTMEMIHRFVTFPLTNRPDDFLQTLAVKHIQWKYQFLHRTINDIVLDEHFPVTEEVIATLFYELEDDHLRGSIPDPEVRRLYITNNILARFLEGILDNADWESGVVSHQKTFVNTVAREPCTCRMCVNGHFAKLRQYRVESRQDLLQIPPGYDPDIYQELSHATLGRTFPCANWWPTRLVFDAGILAGRRGHHSMRCFVYDAH